MTYASYFGKSPLELFTFNAIEELGSCLEVNDFQSISSSEFYGIYGRLKPVPIV